MGIQRMLGSYSKGSLPVVAAVKASCIQLSKPENQSMSSRAEKSTGIHLRRKDYPVSFLGVGSVGSR